MNTSKTFTHNIYSTIVIFLFFAGLLSYMLYSWSTSGGIGYLLGSIIPLIGAVALGRPIIFFTHVTITKGKRISIRYWVGKGYSGLISKTLYEVVVKNDEIVSYRFRIQNKLFQISPAGYIQGDELAAAFNSCITKKKLVISIASS